MPDIKIRAKLEGDQTVVKCLMTHPMETGSRKDRTTNALVPAHFIQEVVFKWKDQVVLTANWSSGVSQNPYLSFRFIGGVAGDPVEIAWKDNQGERRSETTQIV